MQPKPLQILVDNDSLQDIKSLINDRFEALQKQIDTLKGIAPKSPELMTSREAAAKLGLTYWQFRRLVKDQKIPFLNHGNRKLFKIDDINNLTNDQPAN